MVLKSLVSLLFLLLSLNGAWAACPSRLRAGEYRFGVNIQNRNRTFLLYVPEKVVGNRPVPLFFNFHGFNNDAAVFCENSGIKTLANSEGFIAICPYGWLQSWNGGDCCGTAPALGIDDVAFTRAMVDLVEEELCLDRTRIFSGGYSNGGFMSYRLACEASDLISGIGPVAGLLSDERTYPCNQVRPVPVMHFHGTTDLTIRYSGGVESIDRYKDILGCTSGPKITFQNRTASCETYSGCKDNKEVVFCTIQGQGHAWPGCTGVPNSGTGCSGNTYDINATKEMWAFFKRMTGLTKSI